MKIEKTHYTSILDDFNAKISRHRNGERRVGRFGVGDRNDRAKTLVNFLEKEHLYCMDTFFEKKENRQWTWQSPDGRTRNQIDYVISDNRGVIQNVIVINQLAMSSDHRMVRA